MNKYHDLFAQFNVFFAHPITDIIHNVLFILPLIELAKRSHMSLILNPYEILDQWNWPIAVSKIVNIVTRCSNKSSHVFKVGKSSTESYNPNSLLQSLYTPQRPSHQALKNRSSFIIEQMDFINDE